MQTGEVHRVGNVRLDSYNGEPLGFYDLGLIARLWGLDEYRGRKRRIDSRDKQFNELLGETFGPLNEKFKPTYTQIIDREFNMLRNL